MTGGLCVGEGGWQALTPEHIFLGTTGQGDSTLASQSGECICGTGTENKMERESQRIRGSQLQFAKRLNYKPLEENKKWK